MATLRDIRRRITSVKSTQQITRAMKLVAAAKLRRAQERILEARPYARSLEQLVESLAARAPREIHPLLIKRDPAALGRPPKRLLLVVSGDRGLCGAFNSNVIRRSQELAQQGADGAATELVLVGRKVRDFYRRRGGVEIRSEYVNIFDKLTFRQAAEIAQDVVTAFTGGEADDVSLAYNEFRSAASQRVVVERLLPIRPSTPGEETSAAAVLFEPSPEAVLSQLLPRHVEVQVYRALLESVAAEYGARMTAMENATRNASEMIDLLTLQFNKARQERITKELLEIVGGAEALRQTGR
jgi:F-type H+-transporting ATPase subunit gamma